MNTVIGIFSNRQAAVAAAEELRSVGITDEQMTLLEPHSSLVETATITPPQPEPPGACGANSENVQGALLGFAGGLLGSSILFLAVPGIGPIAAVGALGLSSAVGSIAGGVLGQAAHTSTSTELTVQEFLTYEYALQHGKYLLVTQPNEDTNAQGISWLLARHGAEDVDRVRDQWWSTVRADELKALAGSEDAFISNERKYREGFEAALAAYGRQSTCDDTSPATQARDTALSQDNAFERGYARGRLYYEAMLRRYAQREEQQASA